MGISERARHRQGSARRLRALVAAAAATSVLTIAAGAASAPSGASVTVHPTGLAAFQLRTSPHSALAHAGALAAIAPRIAKEQLISKCAGRNAEVQEAVTGNYVYVEWIGCSGIGFAVSTNGGKSYGATLQLPGSAYGNCVPGGCYDYPWDPALAIAPNGTVYAAFMYQFGNTGAMPVVDASFDHGKTFPQSVHMPVPASSDPNGNWGDREFLAVAPNGEIFLTWDYGPSTSQVAIVCSPIGSCSFTAGDLNAVLEVSKDGGKTWTAPAPISPNFPYGGADAAPIVITPKGTLDVLYQAFPTDATTHALSPGSEYFTRSTNAGATWSSPVKLGASAGTVSLTEWWIDGNISLDSSNNLYATWDTQGATYDVAYLEFSRNGGATWSKPVAVTSPKGTVEELVESVGVGNGIADVAWQTPTAKGYATFVRPFSVTKGWLSARATQASTLYGTSSIWPGDTFGIAPLPTARSGAHGKPIVLTWGAAVAPSKSSEIWGQVVRP